jgi:hypothetical protein
MRLCNTVKDKFKFKNKSEKIESIFFFSKVGLIILKRFPVCYPTWAIVWLWQEDLQQAPGFYFYFSSAQGNVRDNSKCNFFFSVE